MAFNVTELSDFVEAKSLEYSTLSVRNAQTAKLLIDSGNFQANVKGSAAVLKLDVEANFQDGSTCSRTALGSVKLSDTTIEVASIADYQNLCPKSLYNTYYAKMLSEGQNPEAEFDMAFIDDIMLKRAENIAAEVEVMLWAGDKSLSGSNNNKYIDGILKQIPAGGTASYLELSTTGADIVLKLQAAYNSMPVEVRNKEDFRIFVGEDVFDEYSIALANKNVYKPVEDFMIFGTRAKLVPTSGLNTTDKIVAIRLSNLQLGIDGRADADSATMYFSQETKNWYQDFNFSVGIKVIRTSEAGIGSL